MASAIPYSFEALVANRLSERLDSTILLLRASDIQALPRQYSQAVYVMPHDFSPVKRRRGECAISESVIVVAAIRNPSTQVTGEASRHEAGPLLKTIIESLLGWVPGEPYADVTLVSGPNPEHNAGFGYYPLAFETSYVLSGAPS